MPPTYHRQILDHLGLVAGMCAERGIAEVIDHATKQAPEMRMVTAGHAGPAMGLNGLGLVNQQLDLVPHCLPPQPPSLLSAPGIQASHLNDDTLGRTLDPLYAYAVTALSRRMAPPAAQRWGLAPTFTPLDSPSVHVDGRSQSEEAPDAQVGHITPGDSREPRPDLTQVLVALLVEPHAGIPVLMQPLRGKRSDAKECGHVVSDHRAHLHTPSGSPSLGADRAR